MTSRPRNEQPKDAGTASRSFKYVAGRRGRVLGAAAVLAVLFLAAAPARTQETTNTPGPEGTSRATVVETENGSPKVGDGRVERPDGERSVRVGDGCVVIEGEGGEDLVVGSCGEGDEGGGRSGEDDGPEVSRRDGKRTAPEQTDTEGTILEETAPTTTNVEESAVPEETAPEDGVSAECLTAPEGEAFEATVERAVDGDTLELAEPVDGVSRVRLIGVDAPELEGEGGEPEPYAGEAAAFTASELEGSRVLLELDREATDPYERLLAYVWHGQEASSQEEGLLPGGEGRELFGLTLLEGGYATATPVEPNTRYADCFDRAERAARGEGSGLWGEGGGPEDGQYGEETEPERTLPENAGGPAEDEYPRDSSPTSSEAAEGPEETVYGYPEPAEQTAPEFPEEPGEETTEASSAQYEASEAPTEVPADESSSPLPEGSSGIEASGEIDAEPAAEPADAPASTLPTQQTSAGPVPVLPDTGGAASLPLLIGAFCLAVGLRSLRSLRCGGRQGDRRNRPTPEER
jgi:endonuclease YncB( thermonuclease family)